jgi:TRAP-type C4-dicarboxylate transport system substrate-binding protein
MDIPFVYNTYEEAWMVLDSFVGTDLMKTLEAHGMKGMAFMENGFRQVTSNAGAITQQWITQRPENPHHAE